MNMHIDYCYERQFITCVWYLVSVFCNHTCCTLPSLSNARVDWNLSSRMSFLLQAWNSWKILKYVQTQTVSNRHVLSPTTNTIVIWLSEIVLCGSYINKFAFNHTKLGNTSNTNGIFHHFHPWVRFVLKVRTIRTDFKWKTLYHPRVHFKMKNKKVGHNTKPQQRRLTTLKLIIRCSIWFSSFYKKVSVRKPFTVGHGSSKWESI